MRTEERKSGSGYGLNWNHMGTWKHKSTSKILSCLSTSVVLSTLTTLGRAAVPPVSPLPNQNHLQIDVLDPKQRQIPKPVEIDIDLQLRLLVALRPP